MEIGGTDQVFNCPASDDTTDIVLRVCKRRWPNAAFHDAEETEVLSLSDGRVWWQFNTSTEFFVYQNSHIAEIWDEEGPSPLTWNLMLHFLVSAKRDEEGAYKQVTVVIDELTPDMRTFLEELQKSVMDSRFTSEARA